MSSLLPRLPAHVAVTLSHNDHMLSYQTVAQAVETESFGYDAAAWVSDAERQKAIDTNECWTLQWYPFTPVGFCVMSASTLEALLAAC